MGSATRQKSPRTRPKRATEGTVTKLCGRPKRGTGEPCTQEAGTGTNHPGTGACRWHEDVNAGGVLSTARRLGVPVAASPQQAITGVLHLAFGELVYVLGEVAAVDASEYFGEHGLNPWIRRKDQLQDRVARYAATAVGMGAVEAQTALVAQQTEFVTALLEGVVNDLGLTPAQKKKLGPAIRKRVATIDSTAVDVS